MRFLDRTDELRRLDAALGQRGASPPSGDAAGSGSHGCCSSGRPATTASTRSPTSRPRRSSGGTWPRRWRSGSPGSRSVEYPDWRSFLDRLRAEAAATNWPGPFILDELPYLLAADPSFASVLQNWLDRPGPRPSLVVSGSSWRMMHGALLGAAAPLYGRAVEAFAVQPLLPGYLADAFPGSNPREQVALYALWGGTPRYWELSAPWVTDLESAVDTLVLDPAGPLHDEPDRLLREETPSASALRPLLDVIGAGAHRISEIAGRLGKPASSLSGSLATLCEMRFLRREIPFGSPPRSGKRSLYRIDDPFLRLWFRVVAPRRAALAAAPRETRLAYWRRARTALESFAWEELCRAAVPTLHRTDAPLGALGPWEPAQRYWRRNEPELDLVARSVDGGRLLVGEVKWTGGFNAGGSGNARDGPPARRGDHGSNPRSLHAGGHAVACPSIGPPRDHRGNDPRRPAVGSPLSGLVSAMTSVHSTRRMLPRLRAGSGRSPSPLGFRARRHAA